MSKFIVFCLWLGFISFNSQAVTMTDVYACDHCDYQSAQLIATQQMAASECTVPIPQVELPVGADKQICAASPSTLIVANPRSRQAFKFQVFHHGAEIDPQDLTLSATEQELLGRFYLIHQQFTALAKQPLQPTSAALSVGSTNLPQGMAGCDNHPVRYFSARGKRQIEQEMNSKLIPLLAGQAWSDDVEDTDKTGDSLTLSRGSVGIKVQLQHNQQKVYALKTFGHDANELHFEVNYAGNITIDGQQKLQLTFKMLPHSSLVDGIDFATIFRPDGNQSRLDFTKTPVSHCLLDYIKGSIISSQVIGGPDAGAFDAGSLCAKRVRTSHCLPWSCREQQFIVPDKCP